jgi:hypothetical protein
MVDGIKIDENVFKPIKAVNELALKNAEKLAQIQVKAVRKNLEVALASARDALDVKSPEEAQAYFQRQAEVAREVMEAVIIDSKAIAKLGEDAVAEMAKIYEPKAAKKAA